MGADSASFITDRGPLLPRALDLRPSGSRADSQRTRQATARWDEETPCPGTGLDLARRRWSDPGNRRTNPGKALAREAISSIISALGLRARGVLRFLLRPARAGACGRCRGRGIERAPMTILELVDDLYEAFADRIGPALSTSAQGPSSSPSPRAGREPLEPRLPPRDHARRAGVVRRVARGRAVLAHARRGARAPLRGDRLARDGARRGRAHRRIASRLRRPRTRATRTGQGHDAPLQPYPPGRHGLPRGRRDDHPRPSSRARDAQVDLPRRLRALREDADGQALLGDPRQRGARAHRRPGTARMPGRPGHCWSRSRRRSRSKTTSSAGRRSWLAAAHGRCA